MFIHAAVDLSPQRAHNILAGRGNFAEILGFEIEMSIFPGLDRLSKSFPKGDEVVKDSAPVVVISANRCLGKIKMAVSARIVALAKQRGVFFVGKRRDVQSMRGAEARLHSKKDILIVPGFRKEIFPLVQADSMNRKRRRDSFSYVTGQALRSDRSIFQAGDVFIQISVIQFFPKRFEAKIDVMLLNDRTIALRFSKGEPRTIIVTV